jgi:hypothetical protein
MADRKPRTTLHDALRAVINDARLECENRNSSTAIGQLMLTKPFLRKIVKNGVRMHLLAAGLNLEIRRHLKADTDDEDGVTLDQLELWPQRHQNIVRDIGRARVYVPSRGEFVSLEPKALTPKEAKEAGKYLISRGNDCIRVGSRLVQLSELGWGGQRTMAFAAAPKVPNQIANDSARPREGDDVADAV